MSSTEFSEWQAYARWEPYGFRRDAWHTALIASVIANTFRGKDDDAQSIEDFILKFRESPEEADARMQAKIFAAFGAPPPPTP